MARFKTSCRLWFIASFVLFLVPAYAAGTNILKIPEYTLGAPSPSKGDEFWMSDTRPLEMLRYSLTNRTLQSPLTVTILHYSSAEAAKKAFELSWRSRPQGPKDLKIAHWDGAHRWPTDIFVMKGNYVVGLYDMPPDFPTVRMDQILHALEDYVDAAESNAAENDRTTKYFEGYLNACSTNEIRCLWFLNDQPKVGMVMTLNLENDSAFTVRDVYNWAMQNSQTHTVTDSQVFSLKKITAAMPASDERVEFNRSVSISLRREGNVRIFRYDRRHAPDVVQRIYDLGGGYFYNGE